MEDWTKNSPRIRSPLFFIRELFGRCFIQIYRALYGDAISWCPGGMFCRRVTETSVVEFYYLNTTLQSSDTLTSSASIVQLAKRKATTNFFTHATAFSGSHFCNATQNLENSNMLCYKTKNHVEIKRCKTPSS